VYLPENTSFTRNYDIALEPVRNPIENKRAVMFFMSIRNWSGFNGFRVNKA